VTRYICSQCGYVYDPEQGDRMGGVEADTAFEELPAGWVCPMCYAPPEAFDPLE
jgi:rubredoxin